MKKPNKYGIRMRGKDDFPNWVWDHTSSGKVGKFLDDVSISAARVVLDQIAEDVDIYFTYDAKRARVQVDLWEGSPSLSIPIDAMIQSWIDLEYPEDLEANAALEKSLETALAKVKAARAAEMKKAEASNAPTTATPD